ncbi:DNA-binding protein [Tsukamurella tyrosinosolvens]|uniref:DNA-binding protein n=1 Tax=Tsukamurella tyrosinosolvens TaxID=57704 RepID=UPI001CE1BB54|nr:DNA-binding protein [Tsukamurella tyrosinosolvens]MCA4997749.1 DNA-binding protein [Tsukamurella tyrosinosolvens]
MTPDEVDALGVSTDLKTAARALGLSVSGAYALAQRGEFPCRVIRAGSRYIVPTVGLRAVLGLDVAPQGAA